MKTVIFVLSHLFAIGLFAVVCHLFGGQMTRRIAFHSALERASFSLTLGLGMVAYAVFFLGLFGFLYAEVVVVLLLVGLLLCRRTWGGWHRQASRLWRRVRSAAGRSPIRVALIGGAVVLCLPFFLLALYPPTAWDATEYHLASARIYVENHRLVLTPYLRFPVFPQTNQMVFVVALLLYDDISAHLVEFLMMAVLATALLAFGERFLSRRAGWWAAAVFLSSPLVVRLGTIAMIDMGLMLFGTMAVYAVWVWRQSAERQWLALAGVFCGLAIGTKYPALFLLSMLTIVVASRSLRGGAYGQPVFFVAVALLVAAPWLARNVYYLRNPLFPFFYEAFGRWFGYGAWGPEQFQNIFDDYARYGMGRDWRALILLPWNLSMNWREFGGGRLSPVYFFAPALLFLTGPVRQKFGGVLALGMAYTLFWFFTVQESRYLTPALPLLSLTTASGGDALLARIKMWQSWSARGSITVLGVVLLLAASWAWTLLRLREYGPIPVDPSRRHAYLAERLPSYPAYQYLNESRGRGYTVYGLGEENMAYFADGVYMGDHFGIARYSRVLDKLADGEALHRELRQLGADHFLVQEKDMAAGRQQDEDFVRHFRLVYADRGILVFELKRPGLSSD